MIMNKFLYFLILFFSFSLAQLPVDLNQNETYLHTISLDSEGEYLMNIQLSSNTSWEENNNESSVLTVFINGEYNQDIIIYNGQENHYYKQAVGFLESGEYEFEFYFDYNKSSLGASTVHIESLEFTNAFLVDIDSDVFKYSPILYGRNIFSWNESNHTDIPLILFYDISYDNNVKTITYSLIFSNEDSRVGIGLSDMMLSWGRTTDIEWIYQVSLINDGQGMSEIFQGAGHTPTVFNGNKLDNHPILINATANCNFSDTGTSDYLFFLSPIEINTDGHTREFIMDENPWSYKIMGQELINEDKYEEIQDPTHWEMSDVRNYLYLEYEGSSSGSNIIANISANFYNDCYGYANNHNDEDIIFNFGNGVNRTAIELPENFEPNDLQYLNIQVSGDSGFYLVLETIKNLFYLSEDYGIVNMEIYDFEESIIIDENSPSANLIINDWTLDFDCNQDEGGSAFCDDCNICTSGNTGIDPNLDLDDCDVCFGNNEDMDCAGVCFGNAYIDDCYVCDDNPDNDEETCNAGCFDVNAENYDSEATIDDGSCTYSDQVFYVPGEYEKIEYAIFFASDGDTVLVSPGTYYEEVDFLSKSISLLSTHGPEQTIIIANSDDGGDGGVYEPDKSVVTIINVSGDNAKLDGFTLENGYGSGVNFEYFISVASDPEMFNDMMHNYIKSGGISVLSSSITLSNLIIKNNTANNFGAGIGLVDSYTDLYNIILENNHIPDGDALGGSGIAINGGMTSIDNCIIRENSVGLNIYQLNGGGGILCGFNFSDTPLELVVTNSEIYNNSANIGAAIGVLSGNILLDRTLIYGNTGEYGSAISLGEPLGLVIDNINMTILQSTISENQGGFSFGLIDNSNVIIANSILWNESSTYEFIPLPNNSIINVDAYFSDIRLIDNISTTSIIDLNPLFNDIGNNDFTLSLNSPCIDSGTNLLIIDGNTIIDEENIEYSGDMPDMGYFEHLEDILYGDINLDTTIDILDIVIIINIIMGEDITGSYSLENADINTDGIIDILDAVILVNIILNN